MTRAAGFPEPKQSIDPAGLPEGHIELRIRSLEDLFHPLDPAPMSERSLAPGVVEYIVERIGHLPSQTPISIRVSLPEGATEAGETVDRAIRHHFRTTSERTQQQLRAHFRRGFKMLLAGLVVVLVLVVFARYLASLADRPLLEKVALGIGIVIWVTLWRPIETLIYDWRPIRDECRIYRRIAAVDAVQCSTAEP